jgi:hypothetical protein
MTRLGTKVCMSFLTHALAGYYSSELNFTWTVTMQPRMHAQLGITDLEGGMKELQRCWRRASWFINILTCFLALFPSVLCLHQSTAFFLYVFVPLSLLVLASLCSVLLSLSHSHGRKENPSVFYVFPLLSPFSSFFYLFTISSNKLGKQIILIHILMILVVIFPWLKGGATLFCPPTAGNVRPTISFRVRQKKNMVSSSKNQAWW